MKGVSGWRWPRRGLGKALCALQNPAVISGRAPEATGFRPPAGGTPRRTGLRQWCARHAPNHFSMKRMVRAAYASCSTALNRGDVIAGHGSFLDSLEAGNSLRIVGLLHDFPKGLSEGSNQTACRDSGARNSPWSHTLQPSILGRSMQ